MTEPRENTRRIGDGTLFWGGAYVLPEFATNNFLVAGTIGSGKTITLNLLLKCVMPSLRPSSDARLLVYDPKTEVLSHLRDMGARVPTGEGAALAGSADGPEVHILNPFDRRSVAWDLAADLTAPEHIQEVASALFPTESTKDPFFDTAASELLQGVMLSLHERLKDKWTLRDALLALSSADDLRAILALAPRHNAHRIELYVGPQTDRRTVSNILATVANKVGRYSVIASYWHHAKRKISLEQWAKESSILVLGYSHKATESLSSINRVMFRRIAQVLLDQPNTKAARRSWVFLDELSKAGKLDKLDDLLTQGRSKGVCLVLAFQDLAGLQHVYGDKIVDELTGQVGNKAILRLSSPPTAKWAERVFGDAEETVFRQTTSTNYGPQGTSTGTSSAEQEVKRAAYLDAEFMTLSPVGMSDSVDGFFLIPGIKPYRAEVPIALVAKHLTEPDEKHAEVNFQPRPKGEGFLPRWTPEERQRLGLPMGEADLPASMDELEFFKGIADE